MKSLVVISLCMLLAACGFKPIYGGGGDESYAAFSMADIAIDNIPDREGQRLRNLLMDRLYQAGRPDNARYHLMVAPITETQTDLGIQKDATATRAQLKLHTKMKLLDKESNLVVLRRNVRAISSYNILESQFTTLVTEEATRDQLLEQLADKITQQLGLYFNRDK